MSLQESDIAVIERIVYKNSDDIAVSIARSFERLEERIDAAESRIYARIADVEDKIESWKEDEADVLGDIREDVRDLSRLREA